MVYTLFGHLETLEVVPGNPLGFPLTNQHTGGGGFIACCLECDSVDSCFISFSCSHSLVPVVPAELLEYVHLPSTYIMGVHTSLGAIITEQGELVRNNTIQHNTVQ